MRSGSTGGLLNKKKQSLSRKKYCSELKIDRSQNITFRRRIFFIKKSKTQYFLHEENIFFSDNCRCLFTASFYIICPN